MDKLKMIQLERRVYMTDFELLKEKIADSGMTMTAIASKSGMLRETLYNRMKGKGEFNASEIVALTGVLHISKEERDAIFFGEKVVLNTTPKKL